MRPDTASGAGPTEIWSAESGETDGALIALIHGTMDRSTSMLKLSRRLDRRFRVLRYDRRGYGRSVPTCAAHNGPFDMAAQLKDLFGLLAGRRALLVGHSYAGHVALSAAMRAPEQIVGAALYETPVPWAPWWPVDTAGAAARTDRGSAADAAERFMRRLIGDAAWDALPAKTRATRRAEGQAMVGELRDLHANQPWRADRVHCPLVLGFGSAALVHHRDAMQFLHRLFPGSQLLELGGCRHDAPSAQSELFADEIVARAAVAAGGAWALAAAGPAVTSATVP